MRKLGRMRGAARLAACTSLAALCIGLAPSAARAQDETGNAAEVDGPPVGTRIIVTAQFREQLLQDVPVAITAVTAEELEQRSVQNVLDLADSVPNVEMTAGGSGYGAQTNQAFIRGLGQIDFLTAFEPRVGFYVDDVYYATTYGSVSTCSTWSGLKCCVGRRARCSDATRWAVRCA